MIVPLEAGYTGPKFEAVEFAPKNGLGIRIPAAVRALGEPSYDPNRAPAALATSRNGNTVLYVHPDDVEAIKKANA